MCWSPNGTPGEAGFLIPSETQLGGDYDEHKHMTKKCSTRFHEPLRHGDSEKQTVGCRQTNPQSCGRNSLKGICAFVRTDGMCLSPPRSWPKQFARLNKAKTGGGES